MTSIINIRAEASSLCICSIVMRPEQCAHQVLVRQVTNSQQQHMSCRLCTICHMQQDFCNRNCLNMIPNASLHSSHAFLCCFIQLSIASPKAMKAWPLSCTVSHLDNKASLVAGRLEEAGSWGDPPMDDPLPVQLGHPQASLPGAAQQCHQVWFALRGAQPAIVNSVLQEKCTAVSAGPIEAVRD